MSRSFKRSMFAFDDYNDEIHEQVAHDIYNNPEIASNIEPIDMIKIIEFGPFKTYPIMLHGNCVIIKYNNENCIIGYDENEGIYKLFAIDPIYDIFLQKYGLNNITCLNILDTIYDIIEIKSPLPLNEFKLIIIR